MIKGKHHIIFDEITYDRNDLELFTSKFLDCVVSYNDYCDRILGGRAFDYFEGYNIMDTSLLEGKHAIEYPIIKELVSKFNVTNELTFKEVTLMHFDMGFSFPIHTDHAMKAGIMFPITPEDSGEPIVFYNYDKVQPATDYSHLTEDDIDYSYTYSNKHPSLFNAQVPHGVPPVKSARLYLKIMLFEDTFESIDERFINDYTK